MKSSLETKEKCSTTRRWHLCLKKHLKKFLLLRLTLEHPVVPVMVRDTERTRLLVEHLNACGVLATGLNFPVVPRGDEEIRFQVNADHTSGDIDFVLGVLRSFGS